MTATNILELLESTSKKKLKLRVNNNRSTMLSVKWEPECTRVSLHQMFLDAPFPVMEDLASYVRRDVKQLTPNVKAFIAENLQKLDYSDRVDKANLVTQGRHYDLRQVYDAVNQEYFEGKVDLMITWFGRHNQRNRSRVTFGLYHDQMRLVKVHRILDDPACPYYMIAYVVYHEMLHHVCPPYVDANGRQQIHSPEFKAKEKNFREFDLAQAWIKKHHKGYLRGF